MLLSDFTGMLVSDFTGKLKLILVETGKILRGVSDDFNGELKLPIFVESCEILIAVSDDLIGERRLIFAESIFYQQLDEDLSVPKLPLVKKHVC